MDGKMERRIETTRGRRGKGVSGCNAKHTSR